MIWEKKVRTLYNKKLPNEEKSDIKTYQNTQIYYERETSRKSRQLPTFRSPDNFQEVQTTSRKSSGRLPGSRQMDRQLHAVYGECLLKDGCWNCVVDKFKGARLFFLSESSTHVELIAMAQEDYNLDKNTESVGLAYSLPEAMMQWMAPNTAHIHITSDKKVRNFLGITKTHEVRLYVSSLSKMRTVQEEMEEEDEGDEADEGDEDDDDMAEDENHDGEEDVGEEDGADEDADIPDVAQAVDDAEDYSEYGKVKDEDEEEDDDMCFEDFKSTYDSEGGRSNASKIYVNQSFASMDALVSEMRLTTVRRKFSFRIYKSTKNFPCGNMSC
ncbi:hypothetical protein IGI04_029647 [Brassica rapa subsp. trilocularis]|uniref:Transposase MuDR plant domain-containing protein n=1 Tax=Brassica rapa subsp. trilocularis TaxID=1813537 RepID=A0ABQ7LQT2_BRACM|nr:hypothetical protein IGI04_029647 [Brassica rapa subsp. trilocularis]